MQCVNVQECLTSNRIQTISAEGSNILIAGLIILAVIASLALWIYVAGPKLPPETDPIVDKVMSRELSELITGSTGYVTSKGLKIWHQSISSEKTKGDPVFLIMGAGVSAIEWPNNFYCTYRQTGLKPLH